MKKLFRGWTFDDYMNHILFFGSVLFLIKSLFFTG